MAYASDTKIDKKAKAKKAIEDCALEIIQKEKTDWETSTAFVTEKVAFNMKEVIRKARKNYHGIFDSPNDPATGRPKIWEHLTKTFVDFVVKNIDLDTKDINFRARHDGAIPLTNVVRKIVKNKLDEIGFGEDLDIAERQLAIDGTIVWANEDELKPRLVNLLNFGIDPHAFSIDDAYAVQERLLPTLSEFKKMAKRGDWFNTDVVPVTNANPNDPNAGTTSSQNRIELYRRVGFLPKYTITGKPEDKDIDVSTECWFSNSGGGFKLHSLKQRKDNKNKGYQEAWLFRVFGRWYGEGIGERLMHKQIQENTNINIRQNRALVSQLGIFLIRQGSGITPQMISRLSANGAIPVQSMQDIQQLPMTEASQSSYKDSEVTYQWSQRLSGQFDAAIGEAMPSSTPATNAVIQQNASASQNTLIKEQFGMFLQRWLKKQAMPIIFKTVTVGDAIRITGDEKEILSLDELQVNNLITQQLETFNAMGVPVDPNQVLMEKQRAMAQLKAAGDQRFITLLEVPDVTKYDVQVFVTNEEFDKGVMSQNLITMLQAAPEYKQQILQEFADLTGMGPFDNPQPVMQTPPTGAPQQNPQEVMTQANTFEGFGKAAAGAKPL
jgi:hypothetical protein